MPIRVPRPIFDKRISPFVRAMEQAPPGIIQQQRGLSDVPILLAKTTADHAQNATQAVELWFGEKGSETASGQEVDAYNRFTDLASGAWCFVRWVDNGFEILPRGGGGEFQCECISGIGDTQSHFGKYVFDGVSMEFDGGGVWSSDAFALDCLPAIDVYYKMTESGTAADDVVIEMLNDADDSLIARWVNQLTYWRTNRGLMMYRDFVHADYADCDAIPNGCPDCVTPAIAGGCPCGGQTFWIEATVSIGGIGSCAGPCMAGGTFALPYRTLGTNCCVWTSTNYSGTPSSQCGTGVGSGGALPWVSVRINGFGPAGITTIALVADSAVAGCVGSASLILVPFQTMCQLVGTSHTLTPDVTSGCPVTAASVTIHAA